MITKKAIFGMSFNWIFAIIAGGFILFIAIYGASKFIETSEATLYTETAAAMISLLDPMETGLTSGKKPGEIEFTKESKLYFTCNERAFAPFGKQTIAFSEKTFGEKFGRKSERVDILDKYIFTEEIIQGKKLRHFSKPFFLTFKVADIVVFYFDDYCFYDTPEEIQEDIEGLNLDGIYFANQSEKDLNCIKVCFKSQNDCDIKVAVSSNYVSKEGKRLYYTDDLLYAAIFSSPQIYECNIKRFKNKFNELSKIHLTKIQVVKRKGCESNIATKLSLMNSPLNSSRELLMLYNQAEEVNLINDAALSGCRIY